MTEQVKNEIIAKIGEAESIIGEYMAKTNEILTTDIDETLEDIIDARSELISRLDRIVCEIDEIATRSCDETEKMYIENSLRNKHLPLGLTTEIKEVRRAAVKMHSLFTEAVEKDRQAEKRVGARVEELRLSLENLREDKKRIDFYAHNKIGVNKGGSFNEKL
ncbi:MAG: hypothetical protein IKK53_00835 [Ruminiclostridium sp.]|mgnify:CR=1 FL=1|nr:hypothetical protein [Ruminiclostridium sp.]MBR4111557.1 hypothetical protein [Ruminiclostridium sp.]